MNLPPSAQQITDPRRQAAHLDSAIHRLRSYLQYIGLVKFAKAAFMLLNLQEFNLVWCNTGMVTMLRFPSLHDTKLTVPDTASYIRGWIQMVLAPNDLFSWNNKYNKYIEYNITNMFTCFFLATATAHNLLCACWHLETMKGSSSSTPCRPLSRPVPSLIWAQLTLLVHALGIRSPLPQNGAPIHRVRAHSLTGIRNINYPLPTLPHVHNPHTQDSNWIT